MDSGIPVQLEEDGGSSKNRAEDGKESMAAN